jgi:hypothetical protein
MKTHACSTLWQRAGFLWIAAALVILFAPPSQAQSGRSTIEGTVTDESGLAVPGVTVTVAAPELQVGQITVITETDGSYRAGDLPAGTYRITFELPGFRTIVRNELRLTIGFVARIDATLTVGDIQESVTVSGASPVVDLTTTTTSSTITRDTLDTVPVGQSLYNVFAMTPGLTTSLVDVGDSQLGKRFGSQNYGPTQNATIRIDGLDIADGDNTAVYLSSATLDEVQVRTSGNDAEVSAPGTAMVGVIKSGSNQFHGTLSAAAQRPELQSSNLSATLRAQGLTNTNPIVHLYDTLADIGGRIIRDQVWFYSALSRQDRIAGVPGFASGPGPDGAYLTQDDPPAHEQTRMIYSALKISYQPTPRNRLNMAWQHTDKSQPQGLPPSASRLRPLESSYNYHNPSWMFKGELQSSLTQRMLLNVVGGATNVISDFNPFTSKYNKPVVKGNPSYLNRETGLNTGASPSTQRYDVDNWLFDGSVSFFPENFLGGRHELKAGYQYGWHRTSVAFRSSPAGNYVLVLDRVGGVSNQPAEIQIRNAPTTPLPTATIGAGYLKDMWRLNESLTLNLGVRIERQNAFMPRQSREASPDFPTLFPVETWNPIHVMTWWSAVPRLGIAWNLAGKTVVKGTLGRYNNGMTGVAYTGLADAYNPNRNVTATYRWRDVDGNGDYSPGEVNLDPNGPDFLSTTAVGTLVLNRDLRQPMTNEATASIERELMPNLAVRGLYVFKNVTDQYATTNVLRPRSAFNIPLTRRDPGPDGVLDTSDDGGRVTIYDYDPAYRGAAFVRNEQRNSDRDDHYQTVEVTMTRRASGRWSLAASVWAVKYNAWLVRIPDNPNDDLNAADKTWRWAANLTGSYALPWGVQFSAFVQSKIGLLSERTNIFRAVDPDGGPRLNQLSTVTMRLEPRGTRQGQAINVVNLRVSKSLALPRGGRIGIDADLFNLFNSSALTAASYVSGPTFGYVTDLLPPRIARFGVRYTF